MYIIITKCCVTRSGHKIVLWLIYTFGQACWLFVGFSHTSYLPTLTHLRHHLMVKFVNIYG